MAKGDRNRRDQLRRERIEAEEAANKGGRNRLLLGYGVAAAVVVAIAVVVIVLVSGGGGSSADVPPGKQLDDGGAHINLNLSYGSTNGVSPDERAGIVPPPPAGATDLTTAAKAAGCKVELNLRDEGHEHIPPGSEPPEYETNPPTSGAHVEPPFQQADGAYDETPAEIDYVHSLEHGRLEIEYSPDLPEQAQLELKGLYDTMYGAALLFPNDKMPYQVAAATWTNLLTCPKYEGAKTLDAIRAFGKQTWGKYGGEPVYAFKFTGPTPAEPEES